MKVTEIHKTVRPGTIPTYRPGQRISVFCRIEYNGERLSITGVEGPKANGDAAGSAGQIEGGYQHRNPDQDDPRYGTTIAPENIEYADGWTSELWLDFLDVWQKWHLNDMQAACEHQRALGWTYATHAGQDCPECGYRIGSAWLTVDVPESVLDFLSSLPDADRVPAWV